VSIYIDHLNSNSISYVLMCVRACGHRTLVYLLHDSNVVQFDVLLMRKNISVKMVALIG